MARTYKSFAQSYICKTHCGYYLLLETPFYLGNPYHFHNGSIASKDYLSVSWKTDNFSLRDNLKENTLDRERLSVISLKSYLERERL